MNACQECTSRSAHPAEIFATIQGRDHPVVAAVIPFITPDHLYQAETWIHDLRIHDAPDASWNWSQWLRETVERDPGRFEGCALTIGPELQGLSILDRGPLRARDGSGAPLAYLEYLAIAPANRRTIQFPTRYKHCGKMLLYYNRHRSVNLGLGGRLGLHSLPDPNSENFYRSRGMKDYGPDPAAEHFRYFEFGPESI